VLHVLIDNRELSGRVAAQLLKMRAMVAGVYAVRYYVRSAYVEL